MQVSELRRNKKWLVSSDEAAKAKSFQAVNTILDRWLSLFDLNTTIVIGDIHVKIGVAEVKKFQAMFLNLGSLDKLMDILKAKAWDLEDAMYRVYEKIYTFLIKFCKGNGAHQELLYNLRDDFFVHMPDEKLTRYVGKLMSEIVTDNKTLMESVNVRLLTKVFKFVTTNKCSTWLDFLNSLCVLNGVSLPRNVQEIMKKLAAQPDLLQLYPGREGFKSLIESIGSADVLQWHLASLRLLGSTCTGKAADNEVKVQQMISWNDLTSNFLALMRPPYLDGEAAKSGKGERRVESSAWSKIKRDIQKSYMYYMHNCWITSESDGAKAALESYGARIWPLPDAWPDVETEKAALIVQRRSSLFLKRQRGVAYSDSQIQSPRTIIHVIVQELQKGISNMNNLLVDPKKGQDVELIFR